MAVETGIAPQFFLDPELPAEIFESISDFVLKRLGG